MLSGGGSPRLAPGYPALATQTAQEVNEALHINGTTAHPETVLLPDADSIKTAFEYRAISMATQWRLELARCVSVMAVASFGSQRFKECCCLGVITTTMRLLRARVHQCHIAELGQLPGHSH